MFFCILVCKCQHFKKHQTYHIENKTFYTKRIVTKYGKYIVLIKSDVNNVNTLIEKPTVKIPG